MLGLDDRIAELGQGRLWLALLAALLLGLRHASDPDHLTAVSTLTASKRGMGPRRAAVLGLWWGGGHALTLVLLGLPVVLAGAYLPEGVQRAAEVGIGLVVAALAVRLLVRWRRGYFHAHEHRHGEVVHAHPHVHEGEHSHSAHAHPHQEALGRTPLAAFAIGLLHGAGGSAGVGILLVAAVPGRAASAAALAVFAGATAASMAIASAAFGSLVASRAVARRMATAAPAFGAFGLLFGAWYALAALGPL
jgi:ABC-type nickel/cobalt efflux system permease component RcnA